MFKEENSDTIKQITTKYSEWVNDHFKGMSHNAHDALHV